jgi:hypothetical protein
MQDRQQALPSDVRSMFDLTAVGAAIENMVIAARCAGIEPLVEYLLDEHSGPDERDSRAQSCRVIARVRWTSGVKADGDELSSMLTERHTNRAAFSRQPIATSTLEELTAEVSRYVASRVHWTTDRAEIRQFAWLIGKSDRLRFEREAFHRELFKQLRMSRVDAERTRDGLDLRTLGLPPGGRILLGAIRNWKFLQAMNHFGASRCLSLPSVLSVIQSGAVGCLSLNGFDERSIVEGGRAFQRLWLRATALGLQLHPLGSLPIFLAHSEQLEGRELTASQRNLAQELKKRFSTIVPPASGRVLQIAFRIGHAPPAKHRSLRRKSTQTT